MLCYVMKKGCQKETNDSRDKDVGWVGLCRKNGRWNFKGTLIYIYIYVCVCVCVCVYLLYLMCICCTMCVLIFLL